MKRSPFVAAAVVIICCVAIAVIFSNNSSHNGEAETIAVVAEDSTVILGYFIDTITNKAKQVNNYDSLGLGGGVDGFLLVKVFPKLRGEDFAGVSAYQGSYDNDKGKVTFTGHAASNSGVITRDGMKTLLYNCAARRQFAIRTREEVKLLVGMLK